MMPRFFSDLAFSPSINEIVPREPVGSLTIFTGGNNSGKSAYLKKVIEDPSKLYLGVNRFYTFHYLALKQDNSQEPAQWYDNMKQQAANQHYGNFENTFFNFASAIPALNDKKRKVLFDVFEEMFGLPISVHLEEPDNEFSNRYISVEGDSLGVTSSGTRLFLGLLAALMDTRFSTVAIDEPELGLAPSLQRKFADIVVRGYRKDELLPHNPNILLSTHSHLFLDRVNPANNRVVSKSGNLITSVACSGFSELHDIQFRLLGNDLSELFLPEVVMFVEGETDKLFLEKVITLHCPKVRVAVQQCGGEIATRLSYWAQSLGDMQLSPYRNRTLVIIDKVKQAGIERACDTAGLPQQSRIEWIENGIEYYYPDDLISETYRKPGLSARELIIDHDDVSYDGISYKKMTLCRMVCERMNIGTPINEEVKAKLLAPLFALTA